MNGLSPDRPNRYDGRCSRCGTKVPAMTGTYDRATGALHPEGACKTTTKTYKSWLQAEAHENFRKANQALFDEAGYRITRSHRIEYADVIEGHGIRALDGGDKPGSVRGYGLRIFRATPGRPAEQTDLLFEGEKPRPDIHVSDWAAEYLDATRKLITLLDSYAAKEA